MNCSGYAHDSRPPSPIRHLILVLGDQLSPSISSLAAGDSELDLVLMCEVATEATYVKHHKKKIILLFSAMRHFAGELRTFGWRVSYTKLDDLNNAGSFSDEIERAILMYRPQSIIVTEPGEWRLLEDMKSWEDRLGVDVTVLPDKRFIVRTTSSKAGPPDEGNFVWSISIGR